MRLLIAGLSLALCACTTTAEMTEPLHTLKLSRGTSNELRHALERLPNVRAQVATDGGSSITSLIDLHSSKTDIAFPVADVAYLAYAGQLDGIDGRFHQLRGMAVTELNPITLLIAPGVKAQSLGELAGLHLSLGAPGSSTALITQRLLQMHGISSGNVRAERVPNTDVLKQLAQGQLDAAFVMFTPPSQAITAAMKAGARLIPIDGTSVEEMRTQYPYLKRTLLPAGTYPNQPKPVRTIGIDVAMVCRADLDEDLVYSLLDAYFATRPAMTPPNLDRAPATPVPLHPGAARYYRQRELAR